MNHLYVNDINACSYNQNDIEIHVDDECTDDIKRVTDILWPKAEVVLARGLSEYDYGTLIWVSLV